MAYTTLARVAAEVKGTVANAVPDTEQQVMGYVRTVTDRIRSFGYEFEPLFYTRRLTPSRMNINSWQATLTLGDLLLECTGITIGNQTATYGTDVLPYPNIGMTPIRQLRIAHPSRGPISSWVPCCVSSDSWFESIAITGFWGMRQWYQSMGFFDSSQTCPALTATQVTFVVSNVDGTDVYNRTPEFSAGNLIRIDNELMEVIATDTTTNTLTVIRGARGTTAAVHTVGTVIRIFEVEEDIANAATRQAALLYAQRGAYQQVTTYPDGTSVSYPSDLLAKLRATVQRFNYVGAY